MRRRRLVVVASLLSALAVASPALSAPSRGGSKGSSESSAGKGGREESAGARRDKPGRAADGADSRAPGDKAGGGDKDVANLGPEAKSAAREPAGREAGETTGREKTPGRRGETATNAGGKAEQGALVRAAHEPGAARAEAAGAAPERTAFTPAERAIARRALASAGGRGRPRSPAEQISKQREILKLAATRIAQLRSNRDERKALNNTLRKAYPDMVHAPSVAENAAKYAEMCQRLKEFNPDAILAMERGGGLVADVVKARDGALGEKVVSLDRAPDSRNPAQKAVAKASGYVGVMTRLYGEGQRRFAVVDFEMGGHTSDGFHPAAREFLEAHPGTEIQTFWIQETAQLGNNLRGESTIERFNDRPGSDESRLTSHKFAVHWAVGEDVELITGKAATPGERAPTLASEPIHIFDNDGRVTHTIEPHQGETSRDIVVGLLSERIRLP
jgi:hypothetical protein